MARKLCAAVKNGDAEKVRALIVSGDDVTFFAGEGLAPVMRAAKLGHAYVVKGLRVAEHPLRPFQALRRRGSY